jgi:hypothetical protein
MLKIEQTKILHHHEEYSIMVITSSGIHPEEAGITEHGTIEVVNISFLHE